MSLEKIAGIIIIAGVTLYLVAMLVSPRLYQESDISVRVDIIQHNRIRWNISQILFGLGIAVPAFGFVLLSVHIYGLRTVWLIYAGAATFGIGSLLGVIFVYRQTFNPVQYWENAQPSILILGGAVMILAGLFFYGVVFLQLGYPNWLGYLAVGGALGLLAVFLLTRGTTGFVVVSLSYVIALILALWVLTSTG